MMAGGDYTFYIATSYGISLGVLLAAMLWPLLRQRRILRDLKRMSQRQAQLEKRRS
jgi:heme exporter protein CcmD